MNLEQQCCSLELAKWLKELGVKQDGIYIWRFPHKHPSVEKFQPHICLSRFKDSPASVWNRACAFTVAELGEMLPDQVECLRSFTKKQWRCVMWSSTENKALRFDDVKEADARAKMLIHLIDKGVVKP